MFIAQFREWGGRLAMVQCRNPWMDHIFSFVGMDRSLLQFSGSLVSPVGLEAGRMAGSEKETMSGEKMI
jgi:hypothetical protein